MALLGGCYGLTKAPNAKEMAASVSAIQNGGALAGAGGLNGFQQSVYPFVRKNCVECHGASQAPLFAVADVNAAYNVALQNVTFSNIPLSKLVVQAGNGHCGDPGCANNSAAMQTQVQAWYSAYQTAGGGSTAPTTSIPLGNIRTVAITIPAPNPQKCNLPVDLACTYDGKNSQQLQQIQNPSDPSNPNDLIFVPTSCTNGCWTKLRFPVKTMTPAITDPTIARAWFEVDFAYENYASSQGPVSYVIKNPRIVSPDGPVYVHDIRIFINGVYHPEYGEDYQNVDQIVNTWTPGLGCSIPAAPTWFDPNILNSMQDAQGNKCIPSVPALPSTADSASGILQVNDPATHPMDQISFSFDYFQAGVVAPCSNLNLWMTNVYNPIKIGAVACLNCHKSGGGVTEAGQRFNMDDSDTINGATLAQRQATICQKFLQRSNFAAPEQSSIIVQPLGGLNGMPAQPNFSFFEPNWIAWINSEGAAQKH